MVIRPSYTSMFPDCNRRQASRMFGREIAEAGFELRELPSSIGASVGTATHAAVAYALTDKMNGLPLPPNSAAEQCGIEALEKRMQQDGVMWDATTPNLSTAQRQVSRQYKVYRRDIAEKIFPISVERRIEVPTRRGNVLSGQVDVMTDGLRDLKTGTVRRANHSQYGSYSLLRRSEGAAVPYIIEDFVQRVKIDDEQPAPIEVGYEPAMCEKIAARVVLDIETKYEAFVASGDPMEFSANPNSMLCAARWCPAHGTEFCKEGRAA